VGSGEWSEQTKSRWAAQGEGPYSQLFVLSPRLLAIFDGFLIGPGDQITWVPVQPDSASDYVVLEPDVARVFGLTLPFARSVGFVLGDGWRPEGKSGFPP
jgi:hypothetical protein